MLPAVLLATVVEQERHSQACGGANDQPEISLETGGEKLHCAANGSTSPRPTFYCWLMAKSEHRFTSSRGVVHSRLSKTRIIKAKRRSAHDQACFEMFRSVDLYLHRRSRASPRDRIETG